MDKCFAAFLLASILRTAIINATDYQWNVNGNGNWGTAANWLPSTGFPNAIDDTATFPSTMTVPSTITLTAAYTAGSVTVQYTAPR